MPLQVPRRVRMWHMWSNTIVRRQLGKWCPRCMLYTPPCCQARIGRQNSHHTELCRLSSCRLHKNRRCPSPHPLRNKTLESRPCLRMCKGGNACVRAEKVCQLFLTRRRGRVWRVLLFPRCDLQVLAFPSDKKPAAHAVHEEDLGPANVPAGQDAHAASEEPLFCVPAGHSLQRLVVASKRRPGPQRHSSPTRSKDGLQTQSAISGCRGKSMLESCEENAGQREEQAVP